MANNRLRWVRDYATAKTDGHITRRVAQEPWRCWESIALGLDPQDRKYLETIARVFGGGPVGVEAVAHTINLEPDTLIDEVEPFLLRSELVVRTPRGRRLTPGGFAHIGILPPPADDFAAANGRCSSAVRFLRILLNIRIFLFRGIATTLS